ncbi:hypothetical protein L1049_000134 [Liquidambar formosana]|uniref:gibberellin 2beta-dioxygenase n=1 Tax=Liquidambar formosana TaxID=63359 RepID=A0AAP0NAX1_LIQFO
MDSDPPLEESYKNFFKKEDFIKELETETETASKKKSFIVDEYELPLIDLNRLNLGGSEPEECKREIADASSQWGFFQVVNHGVSQDVLVRMRCEQVKLFLQPFHKKANDKFLNLSTDSYRWGTPNATSLMQFSWSEAFHIPLSNMFGSGTFSSLSSTIEEYSIIISELAQRIAEILAENLGCKSTFFAENCLPSSCYLRMNRYPPCPIPFEVFGLVPHTDSDFLTILHQDQIGGLQLVKDGKWICIKPNPEALIINIGDLFQAWSNGIYKSAGHRVVTNREVERMSVAYFFCPSYDTVIQSCIEPSIYREFSFREYRQQVQEDVKTTGNKVGLPRFLR